MEVKKIFLLFVVGVFLLGGASALTYKVNTTSDINIVCINAGYCSASAECNVSIFNPNGEVVLDGVQATQSANLASFNITINETQTSILGEYQVGGFCKDGSVTQLIDFTFDVTPTGKELDTSQSILTIGLILILIAIAAFFLYSGNKTEYLPFKIFLTSLGALFIMTTVGFSLNAIKSLMIVGGALSGTFVNLYRLMLILISAGGIGLILYIIYMSVRQFYHHRGLIDKDDDDDD